jgi:hypothetical protein
MLMIHLLSAVFKGVASAGFIIVFKFLIDNIFVMFGGRVFQQTVGIPMGTNCAPYAGAVGMLLHKNGKFTMRKFKSSLLS